MGRTMRLHRAVRPQRAARARTAEATDSRLGGTAARSPLVALQHSIGNRAVGRLVQAKLKVARPGDRFEREAERMADQVMRTAPTDHAAAQARPVRIQRAGVGSGDDLRRQPKGEEAAVAAKERSGGVLDVTPELDRRIGGLGGGRRLPEPARAFFERHFGCDFGGVRVHADGVAAALAGRLRARAFTAGRDIVFGAGEYAPATAAGRSLLAHELAHVVQQAPGRAAPSVSVKHAEREADAAAAPRGPVALSARPIAVQRQPAPGQTGMTRTEFAAKLKAIFGHDVAVEVGSKERQIRELGPTPSDKRRLPDDWKAWDPGANAQLYDEILRAILDFGREVGGMPDIGLVVFYDVRYVYDGSQGKVVADTNAAAEMTDRGILKVYRAALFETPKIEGGSTVRSSGILLPSGRSTAGKKGVSAPMVAPTRAESQRRTIAHELGHGVEFRTGAREDFEKAVGWVRVGAELRLYDIQASGVKDAIKNGVEPPAKARITSSDWNSGAHREQPMSAYAITDSHEDFAESLMAWLYARDVLKARSPARFKFFDDQARRKGWLPRLITGGAPTAPEQGKP